MGSFPVPVESSSSQWLLTSPQVLSHSDSLHDMFAQHSQQCEGSLAKQKLLKGLQNSVTWRLLFLVPCVL